jgi:hypothetical protein
LNAGVTRYNDKGHFVNSATGEELPAMFEKGGMEVVGSLSHSPPVVASTRTIMVDVDGCYGHLGGDSILRMTLDFDEGTRIDEIVNVNVAVKRKFGRESHRRQVRPRTDDGSSQTLTSPTSPMPPAPIPPVPVPHQSQSVYMEEIPDEEMMEIQVLPTPPRQSKGTIDDEVGTKYYLFSELEKNVKTNQIGEKIMDTSM